MRGGRRVVGGGSWKAVDGVRSTGENQAGETETRTWRHDSGDRGIGMLKPVNAGSAMLRSEGPS